MQYDPMNPGAYACWILMREARLDHWPTDERARTRAVRAARRAAHPDLNNGDRARWDQVEWALKVLGTSATRSRTASPHTPAQPQPQPQTPAQAQDVQPAGRAYGSW